MRSSIDIPAGPTPATAEEAADFQMVRPRLFGIAYRLLGRVADAEDVVQDVWVRWQGADRAQVHDRVAFLVKITTRLALNVAVSARSRREVSVDSWFPALVRSSEDPTVAAERSADLEHAVLLLLQRLSPVERAVFVLREAFDYPFRDIAEALGISEANARQLGRRARMHLAEPRHTPVHRVARDRLLRAFHDAQAGAVARLEGLLAADALPQPERGRKVA
jgi:RNA polymerase sigma factor (sigma-70 family)